MTDWKQDEEKRRQADEATIREELDRDEQKPGNPWAKTSSGDADEITSDS